MLPVFVQRKSMSELTEEEYQAKAAAQAADIIGVVTNEGFHVIKVVEKVLKRSARITVYATKKLPDDSRSTRLSDKTHVHHLRTRIIKIRSFTICNAPRSESCYRTTLFISSIINCIEQISPIVTI